MVRERIDMGWDDQVEMRSGVGSWRAWCAVRACWLTICVGIVLFPSALAVGQSRQLPKVQTYNSAIFHQFYLADYKDAGKNLERGARSAYQFGSRRYLDSICFWTMMGECYYHMGNYAEAIAMYEQSLGLYLSYQAENWQARIQPGAIVQVDNTAWEKAQVSWGRPNRRSVKGREPGTFSVLFGRLDANRVLIDGGVVQPAELYNVNLTEIMRCTALCLHRRKTIKGPTCKYDPFTAQLVAGLSGSRFGDGTALGAYNGVLLGIAQASMEDWDKAIRTLKASLQMRGGIDHSLTPVALLELAKIGFATDNMEVAGQLALEASYSAAVFYQYDLVEESLSLGTTIHLMSSPTPYPPLANAIAWAHREDAKLMEASLIVRLAECLAEGGDAIGASDVLAQASGPIRNRNSLGNAVVSARLKYVDALTHFLRGDFSNGAARLANALDHFQTGSLWLYRLGLAESLVASGGINQRQADLLYSSLLRDPTELDWKTDPMESLAFLASAHVGAMERWFDIVVDRKDNRRALEIADLVRRHRFFSQLPMGGRLMAFRWVMHAPSESLSSLARSQRQKFLNQNGPYGQMSARSEQIRLQLSGTPLKPDPKTSDQRVQLDLLKEMASISESQEAILASYALRREPIEMAFPPQVPFSEFQDRIRQDQLAFVTLETASGYHMFLVNSDAIQYVGLANTRATQRGVGALAKKLGLMESAIDFKTLQDDQWKEVARDLKSRLFPEIVDSNWSQFKELVIVPDGALWYLPFEVIPIGEGDDEKFLSDVLNVRYSPTLFLAFGAQRPRHPLKNTVVVTAQMSSRGDDDLSKLQFAELVKDLPDAVEFEGRLRVPTNFLASLFDQLIVWSKIEPPKKSPFAMLPMQIDPSRYGSLGAWFGLPWRGPEYITMPGFQSGIDGMRGRQIGNDLFMTTVGLMASGTRTILISRWNTGGKTSLELSRHYATALPKVPVSQAILEARQMTRELDVDYENEPRLRVKKSDPVIKAEHPFFWAGPMLLSIQREMLAEDPEKVDPADKKDGGDVDGDPPKDDKKIAPMDGADDDPNAAGLPGAPKIDPDDKAPDQEEMDDSKKGKEKVIDPDPVKSPPEGVEKPDGKPEPKEGGGNGSSLRISRIGPDLLQTVSVFTVV